MENNELAYKQKLTDRLVELLNDFKCIDKEFAIGLRTSDIEAIGIKIAEAHKLLQEVLDGSTSQKKAWEAKNASFHRMLAKAEVERRIK